MCRGPGVVFHLRASRIPALLLHHRCSVGCATGVPADCATGIPGAVGPACPLTVRATSFARRVGSKPGQAPPPPTGTAAGPSGALHTSGAWLLVCGSVRRLEAWPCRHSPPPRRGPATGYLERRGCASLVVLLFRAGCAFWIGYVPIQNVITYPDCYLLSGSGACQRL